MIARALAPYLAKELRALARVESEGLDPNYDIRTCRRFLAGLGGDVLVRAETLFRLLAGEQVVDSVELAGALGATPRGISGQLTTPLKRRAKSLQLPLPFLGGRGDAPFGGIPSPTPDMDANRTHWADRNGIAARMITAIQEVAEVADRASDPQGAQ